MKIATWNVNSIRVRLPQVLEWLKKKSPEVLCLQETKVTDEDIAAYMTAHPELDPAQKRAKAQEVLNRAKAGEDFAAPSEPTTARIC